MDNNMDCLNDSFRITEIIEDMPVSERISLSQEFIYDESHSFPSLHEACKTGNVPAVKYWIRENV